MGFSLKLDPSDLEIKVKPFPAPSVRRNVTWAQDAAGRWLPCDRGSGADWYDVRVTAFGTKSEMEGFADWAEEHGREAFTIVEIDGVVFAPNVIQESTVDAVILDPDRLRRAFLATTGTVGVDELSFTLRAVDPDFHDVSPSLASLRLREPFEQDKSTEITRNFTLAGAPAFADHRDDAGRFTGTFRQTTAEARAILRYLVDGAGRAGAFAFPSLPGVTYPFGKARGGLPKQCRAREFSVARVSLDRWDIRIEFVEEPGVT